MSVVPYKAGEIIAPYISTPGFEAGEPLLPFSYMSFTLIRGSGKQPDNKRDYQEDNEDSLRDKNKRQRIACARVFVFKSGLFPANAHLRKGYLPAPGDNHMVDVDCVVPPPQDPPVNAKQAPFTHQDVDLGAWLPMGC